MGVMTERSFGTFLSKRKLLHIFLMLFSVAVVFSWLVFDASARNIRSYSDVLSDSTPSDYSNHTIKLTLLKDVSPSGYIDFVPPDGFEILSTSTFSARNVELLVNGTPRNASSTGGANIDEVSITPGSPGLIRYTLNPTTGLSTDDELRLLIGSQTSTAFNGGFSYSSTTGTTTISRDIGIKNASTTGSHRFGLSINNPAGEVAYGSFLVHLNEEVTVGPVDTTEDIPPERFNGAPMGDISGTTLSVEMTLETNEFAICKYSTTANVAFGSMTNTFDSTGLIVHTELLTNLQNATNYSFYVRCMDDEGNYNTDDYEISFRVLEAPSGFPNTTGSSSGDGTGTGNESTGTGSESGGAEGSSGDNNDSNTVGGSSGGGGSGGGGGGSSGSDTEDQSGGGFESVDAPYRSGDATVIINGYASPRTTITVLVDGQIAETGRTDSTGKFTVTLEEIARGVYTFGIYATDGDGNKSTTFSTSFSVQGARTSELSNINVMPTVAVSPDPVDIGSTVTISGYTIPNANVTIENQNDKQSLSLKTFTTTSNANGFWTVNVSTAGFSQGTYKARAKAKGASVETNFSDYTYYGVGQEAEVKINADLNRDGKVNLVDFSILLYWWGSEGGASDPPADINRDGNVSLTDFSIMLFNWTG